MTGDQLIQLVLTVIASGGGGALVAYQIFKTLGKTWIESKFQKELEQFKHERAKDLARHQVELEAFKAASIKLVDREFEILPALNGKLTEAWGVTNWFASPMQQYSDVQRMSDPELEEFLADSKYTETQKETIRSAPNGWGGRSSVDSRSTAYQHIEFWYRLHRAKIATGDLQSYVASNSLFLTPELLKQVGSLISALWACLVTMESAHSSLLWEMKADAWKKLDAAKDEYAGLLDTIKTRLHSHGQSRS